MRSVQEVVENCLVVQYGSKSVLVYRLCGQVLRANTSRRNGCQMDPADRETLLVTWKHDLDLSCKAIQIEMCLTLIKRAKLQMLSA